MLGIVLGPKDSTFNKTRSHLGPWNYHTHKNHPPTHPAKKKQKKNERKKRRTKG